ncbi:MAG: ABC transporter ATP-binding protein [Lachnospiraceae bacterium]|nr:ABC transporter ATP-binding protein [Lachnospiraceae bacterium]
MSEYAIEINNITKRYHLYDKPTDRFKEALSIKKKKYHKVFEALNDVSFNVKKGEMLGIIGTNGAGKSTMLKIITGVLTPTSGEVKIEGKISALLELGAGFNPEFSGIENVYLNGSMIGFTREEMDEKIDDIVRFADIGDFIYQPVKTYSSGMFARLAFAVAINVEPDILIVDEALSVGDVFFQAKCYKKLEDIRNSGKTVLFVTHDMGSMMKYCNRAIILHHGVKIAEGDPSDMVDVYKKILVGQYDVGEEKESEDGVEKVSNRNRGDSKKDKKKNNKKDGQNEHQLKDYMLINPNFEEYGDKRAEIYDFGIMNGLDEVTNTVNKLEEFQVVMKIKFNETIENPIFAFSIKDIKGTELTGTNTIIERVDTGVVNAGETVTIKFRQKMRLQGGQYLLLLGCTGYERDELVVYNRLYDICLITVISDKTTVGYFDMDTKVDFQHD